VHILPAAKERSGRGGSGPSAGSDNKDRFHRDIVTSAVTPL
jgi:hypothetical protein